MLLLLQLHNYFGEKSLELLSNQTYFKALPQHGHHIFYAALLFMATSWISYYVLAPKLIDYSAVRLRRVSKSQDGGKGRSLLAEERVRLKWGHMAVSFVHALISCCWCLYLWYDNSLADSLHSRTLGYSYEYGLMFSFSMGYFIWDVSCCIRYMREYGKGFLIHAIMGLCGMLSCYCPFMMYPTSRFLLFEVSTLFVDMHWFLEKLGYGGGKLILLNDVLGLLAYLFVRLFFGSYLTCKFILDLWAMRHAIPIIYFFASILAHGTTHTLNFYWFYKLIRSVLRRRVSPHHHHQKNQ